MNSAATYNNLPIPMAPASNNNTTNKIPKVPKDTDNKQVKKKKVPEQNTYVAVGACQPNYLENDSDKSIDINEKIKKTAFFKEGKIFDKSYSMKGDLVTVDDVKDLYLTRKIHNTNKTATTCCF